MRPIYLSLFLCYFVTEIQLLAQPIIPMDQFIGINVRRQDPVNRMQAYGFVREYHEWSIDEGYLALDNGEAASPGYPNNLYKFNFGYQNQTWIQFDNFYQEMQAENLMIAPCLFKSIPYLVNPDMLPSDSDALQQLEQAPLNPGADALLPESYIAYADWLYHYTARNGNKVFSPTKQAAIIAPKLHPVETVKTGAGYAEYIEVWNEQDKYWYEQDYPTTFFEPAEYAAMLSAAYDGHNQTMSLQDDPDNPGTQISTVGIVNADPDMKVITGGLSDLDMEYFEGMLDWFEANRDPADLYPFDVINLHHYANDSPIFNSLGSVGVSPEEDDLKNLLQDFVNLRDLHFPGVELWLSEFGYDTNELSLQRVPTNGISPYTQEEVQGQWMLRSFLEIKAAGFDRAVAFDLRDECTDGFCEGTFVSAGQVTSLLDNYQPKAAWYYTYTMKNVLEGLVYDAELSPCQDTLCNVDCPRVYKFIDPLNPDKDVYAIWSPTSCGKPTYDYPLFLNGADSATLVVPTAPSTIGNSSLLEGTTVMVPVSERPVFVVVSEPYVDVNVDCVENITASDQSCSSVYLNWESNQSGTCQIRYAQGHVDIASYYIPGATLLADEYSLVNNGFLANGLQPDTDYTFFITVNDGVGNLSESCYIFTETNEVDCKIPIEPFWIFDSHPSTPDLNLFDQQTSVDPICGSGVDTFTYWGQNFQVSGAVSLSVDLQQYYLLDAIYIYDDAGIGDFEVEYATSPNGPWETLITYSSTAYQSWVPISNLSTESIPVRYLRFNADPFDNGSVGEMVLCGHVSDFDDSALPPGIVNNFIAMESCNEIDLSWTAPLDTDLDYYVIDFEKNGMDTTLVIPATAFNMSTTVEALEVETTYEFFIHAVDLDTNDGDTISMTAMTLTAAICNNDCGNSCPCEICLEESWITDMTPTSGLDPTRLVDEQSNINPICGTDAIAPSTEWGPDWDPNNGVPPAIAILDLQDCYEISTIYLYDGNGRDTFRIEYQKPNGDWELIANYDTEFWNQWRTIDMVNVTCQFLRFQKLSNEAQIKEISICGLPATCPTSCQIGDPCDDGDACTISDSLNMNCECVGILVLDTDTDGICDSLDNCILTINPDQADADNDGIGDVCDNCDDSLIGNPCDDGDACTISDSLNVNCECVGILVLDTDTDGICDSLDNCILTINPNQADADNDGIGDVCDNCDDSLIGNPCDDGNACTISDSLNINCECVGILVLDTDTDGICDSLDNCILTINPNQADADNDGIGDVCDNCDDSLIGNPCDDGNACTISDSLNMNCECVGILVLDTDTDGICDSLDNCILIINPDQADADNDGIGDVCDNCDERLVGNPCDDGDACTISDSLNVNCECVGILVLDTDTDGICDSLDNCILTINPDQADADNDGIGDVCDNCDERLVGNPCDDGNACTMSDSLNINCECVGILVLDTDTDGICDSLDNCILTINPDQADADNDGIGDVCDNCDETIIGNPCDDGNVCTISDSLDINCNCVGILVLDTDTDGICDSLDNCILTINPDQADADNDGIGDVCDNCDERLVGSLCDDGDACTISDSLNMNCECVGILVLDTDADGICDSLDNCILTINPDQADTDNDGIGDVCDNCDETIIGNPCDDGNVCTISDSLDINCNCVGILVLDTDTDGICDSLDNCILTINPDQADTDNDGIGDVCDNCDDSLIGNPCDDGNACTMSDSLNINCECVGILVLDTDTDGICDSLDNCILTINPDQADADNDGIGDVCDNCDERLVGSLCDDGDACTISDSLNMNCECVGIFQDNDLDGVCDANDLCDGFDDNIDLNNNGIPDGCDDSPLILNCAPKITEISCQTQASIDAIFNEWLEEFYVTDGCNPQTSELNVTAPDACGGTTSVNFIVSDECGFLDSCLVDFIVQAPEPLELFCPNDTIMEITSQLVLNNAFDHWLDEFAVTGGCNPVIAGLDIAPPLLSDESIDVTLTVDDPCLGIQTCTATFAITSCLPPNNITVTETTQSTITIEWDAEPGASAYLIQYGALMPNNTINWLTVFSLTNSYTFIDLLPETTYGIQVGITCEDASFSYSDTLFASTIPTIDDCPDTLFFFNPIDNFSTSDLYHFKAKKNINANNIIGVGSDIIYNAGENIDLLPGFEVLPGADFEAIIEGCQETLVVPIIDQ